MQRPCPETLNGTDNLHWRIFCQCAAQRHVIFFYEGYFSQTIIAAMADAVKMRLQRNGAANATRRRLFSSFIEMTQNIIHYSADGPDSSETPAQTNMRHGSICISTSEERYYLHCANPVRDDVAEQLRKRLDHLRTLTIDEIKQEYKATLRADTPQDSKGAGLGLLTVARDASAPLEFEFIPQRTSDEVLFYLKATV